MRLTAAVRGGILPKTFAFSRVIICSKEILLGAPDHCYAWSHVTSFRAAPEGIRN
jgi:hypothetical protein